MSCITARWQQGEVMVRLEWNALRIGDHVLVHDATDPGMQLLPGIVALVDTKRGRGSNDLGVRVVSRDASSTVLRPARLTVHMDPRNLAEPCWRCDAIAAAALVPVAARRAS
jgi:hypothetical protein